MFSIRMMLVVGILLAILAVPATASAEVPQDWKPIVRANYSACKKAPARPGYPWAEYVTPCRAQYSTESQLPDGTSITNASWQWSDSYSHGDFGSDPRFDPTTDPPNLFASITYSKIGKYGASVTVTLPDGSTRFGTLAEADISVIKPIDVSTGPPKVSKVIKKGLLTATTDKPNLSLLWLSGKKKGLGKVIKRNKVSGRYVYSIRISAPKGLVKLTFSLSGSANSFSYTMTRRVV